MKHLSFLIILVFTVAATAVCANGASIVVNGLKINASPLTKNNRLLAPARAVFESVGAEVTWDNAEKQITIEYGGSTVLMKVGDKLITVKSADGERQIISDVAPQIINGSAHVPVAVLAESLGGSVSWSKEESAAYIAFNEAEVNASNEKPFSMICKGNTFIMGDNEAIADKILGGFSEESLSVYPYKWRTYGADMGSFALIGVNSGKTAAFYSNAKTVSIAGITPGMSAAQLNAVLGAVAPDTETIVINNKYGRLTIFRNAHDGFKVIGVLAQASGSYNVVFNYDNNSLQDSSENMLFNIINAERVNNGLKPFIRDEAVSEIARDHSGFMAAGGVLTHDANGGSPFDKLTDKGITDYTMASESIGKGSADAIEMFASWMNNKMYNSNIISENYNYVGIGAWHGGKIDKMYFTADFIER